MSGTSALAPIEIIARDECPHCERPIQGENVKRKVREDGIVVYTLTCPGCRRVEHKHYYRGLGGQLLLMSPDEIARDVQEPVNRARKIVADIAKQEVIIDELREQLAEVLKELDEQTKAEVLQQHFSHTHKPIDRLASDLKLVPIKELTVPEFIPSGSLDQELAAPDPTTLKVCPLCGRNDCMAVWQNDHTACDFQQGHA